MADLPESSAPWALLQRRPVLWVGLLLVVGILIAVLVIELTSRNSSAPTSASGKDSALLAANAVVLKDLNQFAVVNSSCTSQVHAVTCTEGAERTFGGQLHTYANFLVAGRPFGISRANVTSALNITQLNANLFEILGDAGATQADYNRVLNHVNLQTSINQLENALNKVSDDLHH